MSWLSYLLLALSTLVLGNLRAIAFFDLLTASSKSLHTRMVQHVLQSPVLFFDSNPAGRILNRFSKVRCKRGGWAMRGCTIGERLGGGITERERERESERMGESRELCESVREQQQHQVAIAAV
jgi:hypothetical protein